GPAEELLHLLDEVRLLAGGEPGVARQSEDPCAYVLGYGEAAVPVAEALSHRRCVQRHVVGHRLDPGAVQMLLQRVATLLVRKKYVEEMIVALTPRGYARQPKHARLL